MRQDLDVFFRGSRPYIQGSLILSQAAAVASERWQATELCDAKFSSIVEQAVFVSDAQDASKPFGDATFRDAQGDTSRLRFYAVVDSAPPHRDDRGSCLTEFEHDGELNARSTFRIEPDLDNLLAAIVETTKTAHEKLPGDIRDVWFTGFRGARFPTEQTRIPASGTIEVKNRMRRGANQQFQTLFDTVVHWADGSSDFLLSFAYKDLQS